MPRKRRKDDQWMPQRVYRGKSAYEYHPKEGGAVRLCPLDSPRSIVWREYEKATQVNHNNLQRLIKLFFASPQFADLRHHSKLDYEQSEKKIIPVFGKMDPRKITSPMIRTYMDRRGVTSKVRANRELAFMSAVFSWGKERAFVAENPCDGIRRYKEKKRDRYVEDWEYQVVYDIAPPAVQVAMEVAYLCAARQADVLNLKWDDISDKGVYIKQGKTGKEQVKLWSPRLKKAIDRAKKLHPVKGGVYVISPIYVIHTRKGQKYDASGFKTIWQRTMAKAMDLGLKARFTFHDLKAKGITDYTGDKQRFSGHHSKRQMEAYNRKVDEVKAHDPDENGS